MASPGPNPTRDLRLDAAEKNITYIQNRITGIEGQLAEKFNEAIADLRRESEARQSGDTTSLKKLEETATGGLHISAFGSACLFVGVILSTLAGDLVKWF